MEIITEEQLNVYSQILIPISIVLLSGVIPVIITFYLSSREKNQYIKLLKMNYPPIGQFLASIKAYKKDYGYGMPYVFFVFGLAWSFPIEIILAKIIEVIFKFIARIDYVEKIICSILNIESFSNLSVSELSFAKLNISMAYYSCLNVSIFVIILIFVFWFKFIKSRNLLIPKLSKNQVNLSSTCVYFSYWYFIGLTVGVNIIVHALLFVNLYVCSVIDDSFLLNRTCLTGIYTNLEANLLYPVFHLAMYLFGFLVSSLFICMIYFGAVKRFYDHVIELITRYYKYDFPYVKIKTESGEIEGLLKDILNKRLVTLSEKNVLRIVPWDKIEIMEVVQRNKYEQPIFNDTYTKR